MVKRLAVPLKKKLLNMTDVLPRQVPHPRPLRQLLHQLEPCRQSPQRTQERILGNDVPVDLIKSHAIAEYGENRETTLSAFTTGHSSTLVEWCASFAATVKEPYDLPCASSMSGGGMPQSMS